MSIKIRSNDNGSCIVFEGTTQPAYWYSCLLAEVDSEDSSRINVINQIRSEGSDTTEYEFYKIRFDLFVDEEGTPFSNAPEAVSYINQRVNPSVTTGGTTFNQTEHMDFERDATNTSVMFGNGDTHGVNSIVAVDAGDGTINIQTTKANVVLYQGFNHENLTIAGASSGATISTVINALNAYFTVSPVSEGGDAVLSFDVDGGQFVSGTSQEGNVPTTGTPTHILTTGNDTTSGHGARFFSNETIDQSGEFFTVKITGQGRFTLGLVDQADTTKVSELSNDEGDAHSGLSWGNTFYDFGDYTAPDSIVGSGGLSYGPGWSPEDTSLNMRYNTTVQDAFDNFDEVLFKVGIDEQGYMSVWYWDDGRSNDWIKTSRRGQTTPAGNYSLVVKLSDQSATLCELPKVFHLPVDDTPTSIGDENITIFGNVSGSLAGGIVVTDAADDNDGFITDQVISQPGEYFETTWSVGIGAFGLFSENDHDAQDAVDDRDPWGNNQYIFYGSSLGNDGSLGGVRKDSNWSDTTTLGSSFTGSYYARVGFDLSGRATVWQSADGSNWDVRHRSNASAPSGDYKFIWVAQDDSANLDSLSQGQLEASLQLTYYFIESPDGSYHWPLFDAEEEAQQYDIAQGGLGNANEYTYIDDPTSGRIWYGPSTGYSLEVSEAPVDTSEITYNRIITESDQNYAPPELSRLDITVNELSAVNVQVTPQDVTWQTSVSFSPSTPGLSLVGTNIEGTAPQVAGNNVDNPSDTITATISRTNNYGTTTGSFDIIVTNLTAPATAVTGFSHIAGTVPLVDSDTLNSGSAVTIDETIHSVRRFIVEKTWVESNVLPFVTTAATGTNLNPGTGPRVYFGAAASGADLTDGFTDSDFDGFISWEYQTANGHNSRISNGTSVSNTGVGSTTNALYDYAIEVDDTDVHFIACNANNIFNQPSVNNGGVFARVKTISSYSGTLPLEVTIAAEGTTCDINTSGIAEVEVPLPDTWIQVGAAAHVLSFDGSGTMPTLQAGYTYRFLMGDKEYKDGTTATGLHSDDDIRFTDDGGTTEYTTGITRVGNPGDAGAYIEFVVPSDVPPLQWYTDHDASLNGTSISGSTYSVPITGVTQEGPAGNQTGTFIFDATKHGWLSVDEPLAAGERFVLDGTALYDLISHMPDATSMYFGLKDTGWTDAYNVSGFEGGTYIYIEKYFSMIANLTLYSNGSSTSTESTTQWSSPGMNDFGIFIELTSDGNNIRVGYTRSSDGSSDDEISTAYVDWGSSRKLQTGNQGYGLTSVDVMVLAGAPAAQINVSGMNAANVTWTNFTEVNIPTPATTNTTSWTKALDFSGGSEHAKQVSSSVSYTPISMGGGANQVANNTTANYTASSSSARPWACACVFKIDGHSSNQHIWNSGEGAGSADDNIFLRIDSSRRLYFGWGRTGATNELYITTLSTSPWHAVYVGFTGGRLSGANATSSNLADCFDIRIMSSSDSFGSLSADQSTATKWADSLSSTGARMDRSVMGDMTIGGRGGNRNFHGKVGSLIITTLNRNVAMPTDSEITLMLRDPSKWLTDYKVGNSYRNPSSTSVGTFAINDTGSSRACQVWLMGDGTSDSYSNGMRNQIKSADQNETKLQLNSMVSNDIQNVTITGLS